LDGDNQSNVGQSISGKGDVCAVPAAMVCEGMADALCGGLVRVAAAAAAAGLDDDDEQEEEEEEEEAGVKGGSSGGGVSLGGGCQLSDTQPISDGEGDRSEGSGGGSSLDSTRQLSAMRRISSGGSSGSMSKSSNGGLSLDKVRQLSATQPLSGRNGGGGRSFRALAAMSAVADLGALPSPAVVNDVLAAAARAARTAPLFHVVWRLNLKPHTP
jgi:hypothetical protein